MTQGAGPNEEDYLDDSEKRQREQELARNAPKRIKNAGAAESSTKKSTPNPAKKSQTGSTTDLAASVSSIQELSSETGGSVPLDQESTCKAPKPKPKPKPKPRKSLNVTESSTKKPESRPEGNDVEKSQTLLPDHDGHCTNVRATTEDSDFSSSMSTEPPRECKLSLHLTVFILLNSDVFSTCHASYQRPICSENTSRS
jgi:hypothetical protein